MDSRLHKLWCRPWTFSDCWPNTAGLDLTYNLKVKHYFLESSILKTWTHSNTTVTLTSKRWCFSRIGTRVPKTCGSLWQSDVSDLTSYIKTQWSAVFSWSLKTADPSNSSLSRYSTSSPEIDSPPVSAGHHGQEKEGPAYERRACSQGAIVALTCHQVDLSLDRQDVSRYPWVFAWIRRQTRRPFSRKRLLL